MNSQSEPCGCRIVGTGSAEDRWRIEFCPLHQNQRGTIAVTLVRLEQLQGAIEDRDWTETEFQFNRLRRSLRTDQTSPPCSTPFWKSASDEEYWYRPVFKTKGSAA